MLNTISRQYLVNEYINKHRSTYDIAKECKTYANRIRRLLIEYKIPLRDKSQAQSVAIQSGRHKHPTKGNKRTEAVRIKISEGVAKAWRSIDEVEKQKRVKFAQEQWTNMSEEDREQLRKLAAEAVRKAAEEGSKLEKYLLVELKRHGYNVIFHKANMLSNERLQVDLYLPELRTAIEIDGPSHFLPIWGETNLAKHLVADNTKTGLLLAAGYVLIRIKNLSKNVSKIQYRNLLTNLLQRLESIKKQFPEESCRLIEVELT
jgi:very-short-patch-repair endonuclease